MTITFRLIPLRSLQSTLGSPGGIKAVVLPILALVAVTLAGCASAKSTNTWLTDYDRAQETAALAKKNIFLLVSGDAEDGNGAELRKNVFDDPALLKGLAPGFVSVNLDFTEARYNAAEEAGEGSPEEEQLIRDIDVANKYGVQFTPTAYLLSKEGYVIDTVEIDEAVTTAKDLLGLVDAKAARVAEFDALIRAVETTDGLDKVRAIDALCEATGNNHRPLLGSVFRPVPALDPQDETGVVGKYLLQIAFLDAIEAFNAGDMEKGFSAFQTIANNAFLSPNQKQEALLYLAIFKGETGSPLTEVIASLTQALAASPQSDKAADIQELITGLSASDGR